MKKNQCEVLNAGDLIFITGAYGCSKSRATYIGMSGNSHAVVEYKYKDGSITRRIPIRRLMRQGDV